MNNLGIIKAHKMLALEEEANIIRQELIGSLREFVEEFKKHAQVCGNGFSGGLSHCYVAEYDFSETYIDMSFGYNDGDYYGGEHIVERFMFPIDILENHSLDRAREFAAQCTKQNIQAKVEAEKAKEEKDRQQKLREFNRLKEELGQ